MRALISVRAHIYNNSSTGAEILNSKQFAAECYYTNSLKLNKRM